MEDWRPPILESERLYLRAIEEADDESIYSYSCNEEVAMFTSWYAHESIEDTREFIHNYVLEGYKKGIPEPWGITLKENPEMIIGTVGLTWSSKSNHIMRFHYCLSDTYWGQGIIPEAGQCLIDHAFEVYRPKRIHAYCTTKNKSSAKALEKMGFLFEGTTRAALYSKGEYRDTLNYGMIDADWAAWKEKHIKKAG